MPARPQEIEISKVLVLAWTSLAATGTPGDGAGILGGPWPQYNTNKSNRLPVGNFSGVGYINYTVCEFWDKIANSTIAASSAGPGQLLLPDVRIALGSPFLRHFSVFCA